MKRQNQEKNNNPKLGGTQIFRLACIVILWIIFCAWYVTRYNEGDNPWTLRALFPIVASGVVVFVPLYKKYLKKENCESKRN